MGKLFEDTKYTGLIAKLKTEGIPGYQGNMVTITLPSPTTAYVLPPSSSSPVIPPSATAGSVQPAEAGSAGSAPTSGQAQARPQPQPVPASVTPVKANKVPVGISSTSANVTPVPKEVPMKSVTYEWAPPVANRYLVSVQTNTGIFSVCICVCLVYYCICRTHVLHVLSPQDNQTLFLIGPSLLFLSLSFKHFSLSQLSFTVSARLPSRQHVTSSCSHQRSVRWLVRRELLTGGSRWPASCPSMIRTRRGAMS